MLEKFGYNNYNERVKYSKRIWIKTEFAVCLARAETDLWKLIKSNHNLFNCGNNDRWDTIAFTNFEHNFNSLWEICLNNKYLSNKTTLSHLSPNHKESSCKTNPSNECTKVYASSQENWGNNMMNCLSNLYNKNIDMEYKFNL